LAIASSGAPVQELQKDSFELTSAGGGLMIESVLFTNKAQAGRKGGGGRYRKGQGGCQGKTEFYGEKKKGSVNTGKGTTVIQKDER